MIVFYHIFRLLYFGSIQLASRWNRKARLWVDGRKNWQQKLRQQLNVQPGDKAVWIHCASLGEFEQGRPVMENLKKEYPHLKIVLTFFSPSGYEIRKNYNGADVVLYLPPDSKRNAGEFLNLVQPCLAIFVKYEFWHFYLAELKKRKIETILISGIFRSRQPFFQWWGGFYKNMLFKFSHLFVQNETSAVLLTSINMSNNVTVCGDTRFDRVLEMAEQWQPVSSIDAFIQLDKKILVAGSTWKEDEELIAQWLQQNKNDWQLIIAPHEIDNTHIEQLQQLFNNSILFSELQIQHPLHAMHPCLIINSIGQLSKVYKYADVCYVGGGFNKSGHHNILEAAVYAKAVITGPNFQKFNESMELKNTGGSFTVNSKNDLDELMQQLNLEEAGQKAGAYVQKNAGATAAIMNYIQEKRLFTNA
ncbi:MAG TPA: glycosyltransferase N-terminal domain-containing protein [Lacibacter sp.]|nr:glycosyltransferase N-terminal domain-containing protein [Lacibacter sp.]